MAEALPGAAWQGHFARLWPAYADWLRREAGSGGGPAVSLAASRARLRLAMPQLLPTYDRLCDLAREAAGGELAERFLTLYRPPPFLAGCSILIRAGADGREPILVRNYDYSEELWEGVLLRSAWSGDWVAAMSDCLWGALDGMNEAGLAVALSFGGRQTVGDGFGIPLLVRYLLETCSESAECRAALERLPSHMAYNVSVLDRRGDFFVAYLTPGMPARFSDAASCANHQEEVVWPEYAAATKSLERASLLERLATADLSAEEITRRFLEPPLRSQAFERGFGTLYTAIYRPQRRVVELRWPGRREIVDVVPGPLLVSS